MRARLFDAPGAPTARTPAPASGEHAGEAPPGWCPACWKAETLCPRCGGRRTWAYVQVENKGRSVVDVAADLGVPRKRVECLVEQERDRHAQAKAASSQAEHEFVAESRFQHRRRSLLHGADVWHL